MNRFRIVLLALLLSVLAAPQPWAQVPLAAPLAAASKPAAAARAAAAPVPAPPVPAPPVPARVLTPAEAQGVLDVLQNDAKRAQFVAVLQNMVKVQAATAPKAGIPLAPGSLGAELLTGGSTALGRAGGQLAVMARALTNFPALWAWLDHTATDPDTQARLRDAAWKLAVVAAAGGLAEYLTMRGLHRLRDGLNRAVPHEDPANLTPADTDEVLPELAAGELAQTDSQHSPVRPQRPSAWGLLRRIPYVLLRLLLDLAPVLVFAIVVYALLSTPLGAAQDARVVILGLIDAYIAVRVVMCVVRMMLSPRSTSLRLVHLSDATAAYLTRWARRFAVVAIGGYAIDQTGLLFGMYDAVHDALLKLVALLLHGFALVMVLQLRARVARRLRAAKRATGFWRMLRNWLAQSWHIIAIFYIVALWLIFAFEVRDGYARLWHFFLTAAGVLTLARLASIVLAGALDRALRASPDAATRAANEQAGIGRAALGRRASRYQPMLRAIANAVVATVALFVLLRLWGAPVQAWFAHGALGGRVLAALLTSGVTVLIALLVWEGANGSIQAHLVRLDEGAQMAKSARLRTLLPMLRTTLLVVIFLIAGLMVLNQIGVNTGPILAGASVIGLAIGFGSQKLVQDIITGLFLLLENAMQVGDVVSLASLSGTVETLSIRTIRLRALDGAVHIIPFSAVTTVSNLTRDYSFAMIDVAAGLNEEPDHIAGIIRDVGRTMRAEAAWQAIIIDDLDILGVEKFLDNAWVLRVRLKTRPGKQWAVQREFNRRLKYKFDELAVESPFTSSRILSTVPGPAEMPA